MISRKTWKPIAIPKILKHSFIWELYMKSKINMILAEKYYRLSADQGYLPAQNYLWTFILLQEKRL